MSDLFEDPAPAGNAPEFTVSEISGAVRRVIEGEFAHVRVRGEIGRVSMPRSGHVYMDLKDERNVLSGVIWKGVAARLTTRPEEGLEVVATGRLTTFGGQSKYQIVIDDIAPAGVGALMAMLEKRKKALEAEGLFAPERKKKLPYLPEIIGVVTSPSGAVIRDILHRLRDRFPRKVLVWPVAVQGAKCAPEVTAAIDGFNRFSKGGALPRPDLLIVARGGGSLEDLWGFNEESVARAVAASEIPVISAVGHETDTTLIDFVADQRAPTPTAAAEMAVPVRMELLAWIEGQGGRLTRSAVQGLALRSQRVRDLSRALPRAESLLAPASQRLDLATERLPSALRTAIHQKTLELTDRAGALRPTVLRTRLGDLERRVMGLEQRLRPALGRGLRERQAALAKVRLAPGLARAAREKRLALEKLRLPSGTVQRALGAERERLARLATRADEALALAMTRRSDRLAALDRLRETLGYTETLRRGYAVVRGDGGVVTTKAAAEEASGLEIEFQDGRFSLGGKAPARKKPKPPEQGSLF